MGQQSENDWIEFYVPLVGDIPSQKPMSVTYLGFTLIIALTSLICHLNIFHAIICNHFGFQVIWLLHDESVDYVTNTWALLTGSITQ